MPTPVLAPRFSPWAGRSTRRPVLQVGLALGALALALVGSDDPRGITVSETDRLDPARLEAGHPGPAPGVAADAAIARALAMIAACQGRYATVTDYTATLQKRERLDGRLSAPHVLSFKERTRPRSLYVKLLQPRAGREAIYSEGRDEGHVLAHDVGLGKLFAGTLRLDPRGARAMEGCRHPITEAGLGSLIAMVAHHWAIELRPGETRVLFDDAAQVGPRLCTRIEVTHTTFDPNDQFHRVRLYIDQALGLPIRYEGYDWPISPGAEPPLAEEYTYADLLLNVGLSELDFDVANPAYAFGRF